MTDKNYGDMAIVAWEEGRVFRASDVKIVWDEAKAERLLETPSDEIDDWHHAVFHERPVSRTLRAHDELRKTNDGLTQVHEELQTSVIDPIKQSIARGETYVIDSLDALAELFKDWSGKNDFDFRPYRRTYKARRDFSGSYEIEIVTTDPDMTVEKLADLVDEHTVGGIEYDFVSFYSGDSSVVIEQSSTYVDVDHDENFDLEEQ